MTVDRNITGKIWVISDTHLKNGQILPDAFMGKVNREDLVIHLGDFISKDVIKQITELAALEAVHGNCDPPDIRKIFQSKIILSINGYKIGLIHGHGSVNKTLSIIKTQFSQDLDVILFGHTHAYHHSKNGKTLFFNPGSLTQSRFGSNSFGLLHLENDSWAETIEIV